MIARLHINYENPMHNISHFQYLLFNFNIICISAMFYVNRNLKTQLTFSHYDMDRLHNDEEILKKLKQKVEGRCLNEYGYLIQVTKKPGTKSSCGIQIGVPRIATQGCIVLVTFSAISFKPQKNDIIDIIVTQLGEAWIKGKIGHAQVLIPRARMPDYDCDYRATQNVYIFKQEIKIDKQSKLRCKVFQINIELNYQMRIIACIDDNIIQSMNYI